MCVNNGILFPSVSDSFYWASICVCLILTRLLLCYSAPAREEDSHLHPPVGRTKVSFPEPTPGVGARGSLWGSSVGWAPPSFRVSKEPLEQGSAWFHVRVPPYPGLLPTGVLELGLTGTRVVRTWIGTMALAGDWSDLLVNLNSVRRDRGGLAGPCFGSAV